MILAQPTTLEELKQQLKSINNEADALAMYKAQIAVGCTHKWRKQIWNRYRDLHKKAQRTQGIYLGPRTKSA